MRQTSPDHEHYITRQIAAFRTPWGPGTVVVEDGRLSEVGLPDMTASPGSPGLLSPSSTAPGCEAGEAERWARELDEYFAGVRLTWEPACVDLDALGLSPFRRGVYQALLRVPAGATISYGELAELAGYPRAARAVGSAMAANPIPIVVPCHRVVRGDGTLGRYGSCDAWKPWLLAHEGWTEVGPTGE
jgi:methylated-DNA-[protein]-cysteine S-methyltransferase